MHATVRLSPLVDENLLSKLAIVTALRYKLSQFNLQRVCYCMCNATLCTNPFSHLAWLVGWAEASCSCEIYSLEDVWM